MHLPRSRRYALAARWYDQLSGERAVYRLPRLAGIRDLALQPGDRVLDVGCGTGLNLPLLAPAVGPSGAVVGLDASAAMLDRARRRVRAAGWTHVHLLEGDAARLDLVLDPDEPPFDAVLFTYALSIFDGWQEAFDQAVGRLRPGGRVVVVDLALPTGRWRWMAPFARLACFTGGADPHRQPWSLVTRQLEAGSHTTLRGGHVHLAVGRVVGPTRPGTTRRVMSEDGA